MDEYDLGRGSRASSPGDDYIDVEGNVGLVPPNSIHRTMGADTSLSHATPPTRKPAPPVAATPEVKRGRGRPRKQRDPVEEGMLYILIIYYYYRTNPPQSSQELVLHCTTPHTYKYQFIYTISLCMYIPPLVLFTLSTLW